MDVCQMLRLGAALLLLCLGGCSTWHDVDKPSSNRSLPAPRRQPGGAVLDVAFISIMPASHVQPDSGGKAVAEPQSAEPTGAGEEMLQDDVSAQVAADDGDFPAAADAAPQVEDIWNWIDETAVSPEVRQAWRRNGLRIGKAQRVGDFTQRLDRIRRQQDQSAQVLEIADVQSDLSHQARKISCRIGKRYELPVRQPAAGDQPVLVTLGGQTLGKTLANSQPLFALRATAADVNSIKLSLLPEIQHGTMRQMWVGSDAALRIDNRREAWSLDELFAELRLAKGGMLVAGCIEPAFGLGKHMFTGLTADGDTDRVLMVIRVADLPDLIDQ